MQSLAMTTWRPQSKRLSCSLDGKGSPHLIQILLPLPPRSSNFVSPASPRVCILDINDMAISFGHNLLLADKLNTWELTCYYVRGRGFLGIQTPRVKTTNNKGGAWLSAVGRGNQTRALTQTYVIRISLMSLGQQSQLLTEKNVMVTIFIHVIELYNRSCGTFPCFRFWKGKDMGCNKINRRI